MSKHFFSKYLSFTPLYEDRLMLNCSCWTDLSSLVWKWTRAQCVPRYTCQLCVCDSVSAGEACPSMSVWPHSTPNHTPTPSKINSVSMPSKKAPTNTVLPASDDWPTTVLHFSCTRQLCETLLFCRFCLYYSKHIQSRKREWQKEREKRWESFRHPARECSLYGNNNETKKKIK